MNKPYICNKCGEWEMLLIDAGQDSKPCPYCKLRKLEQKVNRLREHINNIENKRRVTK